MLHQQINLYKNMTTIKTKKVLVAIFAALCLSSCNNDRDTTVQYQFTTNVDISEVANSVKVIKGLNGPLVNIMSSEDAQLYMRINYLVYDKGGSLIHKDKKDSRSSADKVTFSAMLDEDDYTVVVWAETRRDMDEVVLWNAINMNSLQTLKLETSMAPVGDFGIMGVSKNRVTLNKPLNTDMKLRKTGAYYLLYFHSNSEMEAYLYIRGYMGNIAYIVDKEETDVLTYDTNLGPLWKDIYEFTSPQDVSENMLLGLPCFLFPSKMEAYKIEWASLDKNFDILNAKTITIDNVEADRNVLVDINVKTGESKFIPMTQ
ncbi:hypothetical protein AGMMS49574_03800 [Bacteroidia bacterium]|nr:hypothetical protein AGMMS49574_03800 [Bacteroidia bacterium]